jgi:hypothetical protein
MHTYIHTSIHTYKHTYIHTYIHKHTHRSDGTAFAVTTDHTPAASGERERIEAAGGQVSYI